MLMSVLSPSFWVHFATSSSNGISPGACRYATRKSIQVHSMIAILLKLPMLRVFFMPFSAFDPCARQGFGDEYAPACTFLHPSTLRTHFAS
jgi:hypothetical protein